MATSSITAPVTMPFNEYKWLWASWTVREIFKSEDVFPKTVKIMYKYNGLPFKLDTSTGRNFHDELMRLNLTDERGEKISFVSNRSFLSGYQPYWTNTGILSVPSLNNNMLVITPLGKALATGKISFSEYIKIIASRFQFPSLITQYENYQNWLSNGVVIKPFIFTLKVLLELYKQGGFVNSYISEQEMALILVPLVPTMTPNEVANEIIAWREGDPSFNLSYLYKDFYTTPQTYRNIKEFLQLLSIGNFLINTKMRVKSFNRDATTSTISDLNCYFFNTVTNAKWGQLTSKVDLLSKIEYFCEESENSGYFAYNSLLSEKEHKLKFIEYVGAFDNVHITPTSADPEINEYIDLLKTNKQIIFAGAPGIGKTKTALDIAEALQSSGELAAAEIVLFHQATSYEDFIEGIRPNVDSTNLSYSYKTGKFKLLCEKAHLNPDKDKYYLLIIDEINRGNISSIFGELIFLLEPAYRKAEYQIELQYTGDYFYVPENVLIIGTMNTIDKSAVEIDLALRRRFKFINLRPNSNVIKEELSKLSITINDASGNPIDIPIVHKNLNELIADEVGLGEDFCIGHSFFLPKPDKSYNTEFLLEIWNFSLIPLLNEYIILSPRFKNTLEDYGFNIIRGRIYDFDMSTMYNTMAQLSR